MLSFNSEGFGQYAPIGPLILYIFLLLFVILFYCRQSSINHTVHLTLVIAVAGVIYASCLTAESLVDSLPLSRTLAPLSLFFGLSVVPITWTVGGSLFSILLRDRKIALVQMVYLTTLLMLALIMLCAVYFSSYLRPTSIHAMYLDFDKSVSIFKIITYTEWLHFLLFFSLFFKFKPIISQTTSHSLVTFCALNTIRLIVDTFYLKPKNTVDERFALYIQLFFTDSMTVISLFISTIYWSDLKPISNEKYINK